MIRKLALHLVTLQRYAARYITYHVRTSNNTQLRVVVDETRLIRYADAATGRINQDMTTDIEWCDMKVRFVAFEGQVGHRVPNS